MPRNACVVMQVRLCKFCLLGVSLPVFLLCLPLYMRFISLRPHLFTLSPADMKLLNYEHTVRSILLRHGNTINILQVSTMWCSGQQLRMNSSFNAYLLPEKPRLLPSRSVYIAVK